MPEPIALPQPKMNTAEVAAFLEREFPQLGQSGGRVFELVSVGPMTAAMRLKAHSRNLRPGGTISGPAMFALADVALYVAILAQIGPVGLAVTTNMNINFITRPPQGDIVGEARLFRVGKRLAVGEVIIRAEGDAAACAHATGTYSIPPR